MGASICEQCEEQEVIRTWDNANPYGKSTQSVCQGCWDYNDNFEPSDDDIYNGPGMEGGIAYSN